MAEFDFDFTSDGEIVINSETHDINKVDDNELRIQLGRNRIKSISHDWFIDEIGANLEELVGKPCNKEIAELGKLKIMAVLVNGGLWSEQDVFIKCEIKNNTNIVYNVFLKIYDSKTEDTSSYEIIIEIDLIKGVYIKYGWDPRR